MESAKESRPGALRIGTLVGVDVYVSSTWILVALLFAVSLAPAVENARPGLGGLKYLAGVAFVVLFYLSVLLHEMSHAVAARRFGIGVRSITLSFFGGATEIEEEARQPRQEFWIAVVGPVTSIGVGAVMLPLLLVTPDGLLRLAVGGLAATNIAVGVLNLVPGLPFDGGRLLKSAVWAATHDRNRGTLAAGWAGRVIAVLLGASPLWMPLLGFDVSGFDLIFMPILAFFLWSAASASIAQARFRLALPDLDARALARRTLAVPAELPLAEAVRRAQAEGAGGIVSLDSQGRPAGIVNEAALVAVPAERRPWLPVSTVSRTLEPGLMLPLDIDADALLLAIQRTPATEYLLMGTDGSIFGVLATADVDRAFAAQR